MLTATACKNFKPLDKQYKKFDAHGLYLLVMPNGSKYWRLKYQFLKKEKHLPLGVYPEISLAEAREKQAEARKLAANGEDPTLAKLKAKRVAILGQANNFEAIAREWLDTNRSRWDETYANRTHVLLQKDIFPLIGKMPIADITTPDILAIIRQVERRGALDVATRAKQRCAAIFQHAIETGRATINPASGMRNVVQKLPVEHRKHLPAEELPHFLALLDANNRDSIITTIALRMLLLTFVRSGELRGAKWAEFDFAKSLWNIPSERMKMKSPHVVPLSKQVLALIEQLRPISGHREHLFPNAHNPRDCMSENAMGYCMNRMGYHGKASPHGFRGTASTILNEQGYRSEIIECQLAHQERDQVRRAYNHAKYLDDRRKMMQDWADYIDKVKKANLQ